MSRRCAAGRSRLPPENAARISASTSYPTGLVRFAADVTILTPREPARGNHRLLIDIPNRGNRLAIGRMSVPAEVDAEWNAWYSGEYVPGYRKVPGVIYARRYRVLEGTSGYSTVYEFASTAVPESPELKEQQQHSSPNSPRMRQAMTHAPGSAGVYVRVNP